jgi:hypothetical protein
MENFGKVLYSLQDREAVFTQDLAPQFDVTSGNSSAISPTCSHKIEMIWRSIGCEGGCYEVRKVAGNG